MDQMSSHALERGSVLIPVHSAVVINGRIDAGLHLDDTACKRTRLDLSPELSA